MIQAAQPGSWLPRAIGSAAVAVLTLGVVVAATHTSPKPRARPSAGATIVRSYQSRVVLTPPGARSPQGDHAAHPARRSHHPARTSSTYQPRTNAPRSDLRQVPSQTVLASLRSATPGFATASAVSPAMRVPGGWYGRTSVLPVVSRTRSRLQVRLARRPNESTIWVNRRDVTLSSTRYALLVDISARRLYLFRNGQQLSSYPVGVGVPATPTPTGSYFLAFHAPPNGPGYGPVMLETSAHSTAFTTFEGGNDAIIAIHGPIDSYSDSRIGTVGAALSNGCIRMHNSDLVKVARAPDGTPIVLVH